MARNGHPVFTYTDIIKRALEHENVVVGWSGGRCSTIVLHKVLQYKPDVQVIYTNTGIEFPENVEYVHELTDLWGVNLAELRPERTFWDIVDEFGMPKFRKFGGDRRTKLLQSYGKKVDRRPMCCFYLKEKPRYEYYKQHNIEADITGLRAAESRVRAIVLGQKGQFYEVSNPKGLTTYHPISLWSTEKCEAYNKKHRIPHNPVYDTQTRNGCWACTAYKGWKKNILNYNPRMYKLLQGKLGVTLMDDYIPNLMPCDTDFLDKT